jgi:spore maturation protein CgeB
MKILLVGSLNNYAIERWYLKYLKENNDVETDIFDAQGIFMQFYQKSIFNKIIFRMGFQMIYNKINTALKDMINNYAPDFMLVFKGMEIYPKTLEWAKHQGIKIVNYNPDNPFIFSGKGSGNSNITRSVSLYDLYFTYNLDIKKKIEEQYKAPTYWLPFGYEIPTELYKSVSDLEEIIKVCFVGNPDKLRAEFLKNLAQKNVKIDVYGNNWDRFINHPNITLYPAVYNDDLWSTLRRYRVQLNPLRIHNFNSHGMRSFEVPGIGGIMLAPRTTEHLQFFTENKEAFYYDDYIEAVKNIHYLLSLNKAQADEIRLAAKLKSIISKYDYKSRANYVISILRKYINE